MPAECESVTASGTVCAVLAIGRCSQCERAYCRSHGTGARCFACPPVDRTPGRSDRFSASSEYTEDATAKEEAQARDVLVQVAVQINYVSIGEVRRCLDLGPRWPTLLPGGYYNHEPAPQDEIAKDVYVWSIIRELVKFGMFYVDKGEKDRTIWLSEFDSPGRCEFEDYGIQIDKGPPTVSSSGAVYDGDLGYRKAMLEGLRARRPSRFFVDAYRKYWAPIEQAKQALGVLPAADDSALVRYIKSGAVLEPDAWSLENGVRLEPVPWGVLARALTEAGVPFGPGGIAHPRKNWLGRERLYLTQGWVLSTVAKEGSRGNYDQVTRLLLPDGRTMNRQDGFEEFPGKPHPTQIRDLIRRHRSNDESHDEVYGQGRKGSD